MSVSRQIGFTVGFLLLLLFFSRVEEPGPEEYRAGVAKLNLEDKLLPPPRLDWNEIQRFFQDSETTLGNISAEPKDYALIQMELEPSPSFWIYFEEEGGVAGRKLVVPTGATHWRGVLRPLIQGTVGLRVRRVDAEGNPIRIRLLQVHSLDPKYYLIRDSIRWSRRLGEMIVLIGMIFVWVQKNKSLPIKSDDSRPIFLRYPRATVLMVVLALMVLADWILGVFLIQRLAGVRDYYCHHSLRANVSVPVEGEAGKHIFVTNSLGMRDSEHRAVAMVPSGKRLTLIGDSFMQDSAVPYDSSVGGIIGRALAVRGIEVLNAGVQSYSPKLYFLRMHDLMVRQGFRTDELWVFIDISDIQDEVNYWWFEPENPSWIQRNADGVGDWISNHLLSVFLWKKISAYQSPEKIVSHRPALGSGETNAVTKSKSEVLTASLSYQEAMEKWIHGESLWSGGKSYYEERDLWTLDPAIYGRWGKAGAELGRLNMIRLQKLCERYQVRLGIVVYPHIPQIEQGDRESLQVKIWEQFCRERGIPFVNLFSGFFEKKRPEEAVRRYFNSDDRHWSPEGSRLIARDWLTAWERIPGILSR